MNVDHEAGCLQRYLLRQLVQKILDLAGSNGCVGHVGHAKRSRRCAKLEHHVLVGLGLFQIIRLRRKKERKKERKRTTD